MRVLVLVVLALTGCAVPKRSFEREPQPLPSVSTEPKALIFYVPQTDDSALTWLKWFDAYPELRLAIAVSPRFMKLAKEQPLKSRVDALVQAGRLELALQIPNAPILPLLMENPPYGYTDDVVQLIAQSKAGFYKMWGVLPKGMVLPYGVTSPRLLALLERSGFSWVCGALGLEGQNGPFQTGSLLVWDGAPMKPVSGLFIRVWDERQTKDRPLAGWISEAKKAQVTFALPRDLVAPVGPLDKSKLLARTWDGSDLSLWIGEPSKNGAWVALQRTRAALEKYKNSGQASVARLDAAFSEIYSAQSSNFFASFGNSTLSPVLVEDRSHEFQATLSTVYRMIAQPVPDDLFSSTTTLPGAVRPSSTTARTTTLPDGGELVVIHDAVGDPLVPGGEDIASLEVQSSSDSLRWTVRLTSSSANPVVEVYVDLNGQPNIGTTNFLPGRPLATGAKDAWEFALSITPNGATLYRTQGGGSYAMLDSYPVKIAGETLEIIMQPSPVRGRISRWGYQVLTGSAGLSDFIDPFDVSQKEIWDEFAAGNRHDIPFVRIKQK